MFAMSVQLDDVGDGAGDVTAVTGETKDATGVRDSSEHLIIWRISCRHFPLSNCND